MSRHRTITRHVPPTAHGTTLVEVLVAMAVFAFFMLGAASAQLVAISSARDANMRSYAAFSADNLAALIRGNPAFWRNLDADFQLTLSAVTDPDTGNLTLDYHSNTDLSRYALDFISGSCNITTGGCLPSEIAVYDLKKWARGWVLSVVDGVATIENIAPTGEKPLFEITLAWRQKQLSGSGAADTGAMLDNQYSTRVKL